MEKDINNTSQATEAQRFVRDLTYNLTLLKSFLNEEEVVSKNKTWGSQILDNWLLQEGYNTTIQEVCECGSSVLSTLSAWEGTYTTTTAQQSDPSGTSAGQDLVITSNTSNTSSIVTFGGEVISDFSFSWLNLSWSKSSTNFSSANVVFHQGAIPAKYQSGNNKFQHEFLGSLVGSGSSGLNWVGVDGAYDVSKVYTDDTFINVLKVINNILSTIQKVLQNAVNILQLAELYHKLTAVKDPADKSKIENEINSTEKELNDNISDAEQSLSDAETAAEEVQSELSEAATEAAAEAQSAADAAAEAAAETGGEVVADLCCCCL